MDLYGFSYLMATLSLTGVARLLFEVSGHLQMGLIGKTIDKEREIATPFSLSRTVVAIFNGQCHDW